MDAAIVGLIGTAVGAISGWGGAMISTRSARKQQLDKFDYQDQVRHFDERRSAYRDWATASQSVVGAMTALDVYLEGGRLIRLGPPDGDMGEKGAPKVENFEAWEAMYWNSQKSLADLSATIEFVAPTETSQQAQEFLDAVYNWNHLSAGRSIETQRLRRFRGVVLEQMRIDLGIRRRIH